MQRERLAWPDGPLTKTYTDGRVTCGFPSPCRVRDLLLQGAARFDVVCDDDLLAVMKEGGSGGHDTLALSNAIQDLVKVGLG